KKLVVKKKSVVEPGVNLPVAVEKDRVDEAVSVKKKKFVVKKKSIVEKDVEHEVNLPVALEKDRVDEAVSVKKKKFVIKKKSVYEKDVELEVNHPVTATKDPLDKEAPVKKKKSVVKVNLPVKASKRTVQRPQREAAKRKSYAIDESSSDVDDYVKHNDNNHINDDDVVRENGLVRFGKYQTSITAEAFETIKWSSYVFATRQLLRIIFTRDMLATHSLTGRRTFINDKLMKEPRPQLDFRKVEDLISIVSKRCGVKEVFAIRRIIRNKCLVELRQARKLKNGQSQVINNI
ncbi:PREDICTED: protein insensitive-like, partial [Nicrophorus vespilloides]|uniref:Protein insensitive-like n=1 Tax=Nicrophorus vespilloides TaxID=110193 RepID=A0ABM1NK24_NICVS